MSLEMAIQTWRDMKDHVTAASLDDKARHELLHLISETVNSAIKGGLITYEEFERRINQ